MALPVASGDTQFEFGESLNRTERQRKEEFTAFGFQPACMSWEIDLPLPFHWDLCHWLPWSSGLNTRLELHHWLSWTSSLQTADCGTSSLHIMWTNSYNEPFPLYVYAVGSVFLENPSTITGLLCGTNVYKSPPRKTARFLACRVPVSYLVRKPTSC